MSCVVVSHVLFASSVSTVYAVCVLVDVKPEEPHHLCFALRLCSLAVHSIFHFPCCVCQPLLLLSATSSFASVCSLTLVPCKILHRSRSRGCSTMLVIAHSCACAPSLLLRSSHPTISRCLCSSVCLVHTCHHMCQNSHEDFLRDVSIT